jgi:hypothetical protein
MVAPKHKAINYIDQRSIIDAYEELNKLKPDADKIRFLIGLFNEFHNNEMLTWRSYSRCMDCKNALRKFFRYVIEEWKKTL